MINNTKLEYLEKVDGTDTMKMIEQTFYEDKMAIQLDDMQNELNKKENKLSKMEVELSGMTDELNKKENKLSEMEVELSGMTDELNKKENKLSEMEVELSGMTDELNKKNNELMNVNKDLLEKQSLVHQLTLDNQELILQYGKFMMEMKEELKKGFGLSDENIAALFKNRELVNS